MSSHLAPQFNLPIKRNL